MRRPSVPINRSRTFYLIECHEVVWRRHGTVGGFARLTSVVDEMYGP